MIDWSLIVEIHRGTTDHGQNPFVLEVLGCVVAVHRAPAAASPQALGGPAARRPVGVSTQSALQSALIAIPI